MNRSTVSPFSVFPEKKLDEDIKATRYALLKNPQDLTEHQEEQLKFLTTANPRL